MKQRKSGAGPSHPQPAPPPSCRDRTSTSRADLPPYLLYAATLIPLLLIMLAVHEADPFWIARRRRMPAAGFQIGLGPALYTRYGGRISLGLPANADLPCWNRSGQPESATPLPWPSSPTPQILRNFKPLPGCRPTKKTGPTRKPAPARPSALPAGKQSGGSAAAPKPSASAPDSP